MTKKEALKILKSWDGYMFLEKEEGNVGYSYKREVSQEAINVAIEVLEREIRWEEDNIDYHSVCTAEPEKLCQNCKYFAADDTCKQCLTMSNNTFHPLFEEIKKNETDN